MLIQKNPQLKEDAGWLKNIMLQHAYVDEKYTKLLGVDYLNGKWVRKEETVNLVCYKTDKGEYKHPIDMNAEMAKRFEKLEKMCNINEPLFKVTDKRALSLQELYADYKAMPLADVKKRKAHIKRSLNEDEKYRGVGRSTHTDFYDELYVIEDLLKIK